MIYDFILVGAGLFNSLLAYRMHSLRPQVNFLLLDKGLNLGGEATWSFHLSDLDPSVDEWIKPFVSRVWAGQSVCFPEFTRQFSSPYASIRSSQLHWHLIETLGERFRPRSEVVSVGNHSAELSGGEVFSAETVLDGRGFARLVPGKVGYQKFGGWDVKLKQPHGVTYPLLMDATVEQKEGFRFFYLLPWSRDEILVEDTRYTLNGKIDKADFRGEISAYIHAHGWEVEAVQKEEWGSLPIPLSSHFSSESTSGLTVGVRGGFFHATTGYSLPDAIRLVERLVSEPIWDLASWSGVVQNYQRERASAQAFYRFLNRMLLKGAAPAERYRVLEKFYRLPEDLIARFYAGESTWADRARMLWGRPPLPLHRAVVAHA